MAPQGLKFIHDSAGRGSKKTEEKSKRSSEESPARKRVMNEMVFIISICDAASKKWSVSQLARSSGESLSHVSEARSEQHPASDKALTWAGAPA